MKYKYLAIIVVFSLIFSSLPVSAQGESSLAHITDEQLDTNRPRYNVIELGGLGGNTSKAWGINDAGQVVGTAYLSDDTTFQGYLWQNGALSPLPTLGGGKSDAIDINEAGKIVGTCQLADGTAYHACQWENGNLTDLNTLGGDGSKALSINESGQIVGYSYLEDNQTIRAVLWHNSSPIGLNTLGGTHSSADSINDAGQIVGYSYLSGDETWHAVLWENGTPNDLGTLGGSGSQAYDMNNAKQITGYSYLSGNSTYHAFLWQNNQMTDLLTLGGNTSHAISINDYGQIVGTSSTGTESHAFLWENGQILNLNDLISPDSGWILNRANHINNDGEIVGDGTYNGQTRAFLLTYRPVLIVPGIAGTFPADNAEYFYWLLTRGVPPEDLQEDPLSEVYDDLIATLEAVGYTRGKNLFVVNYDWRLPPGPTDDIMDGHVDGLTAAGISDTYYRYGVDYLGFYLRKAAEAFAANYPGTPLDKVDVIAHSTGGLVTRSYIQSDAYGGLYDGVHNLPEVENFIMIGVPSRGASKAWNPLQNDWNVEVAYSMVLAKIVNLAYQKVLAGETVSGPDYDITKAGITVGGKPDPLTFIQHYIPTIRSLLATYDFIDYGQGYQNVNIIPGWSNDLLLDLNNGLDLAPSGDPNSFADQAKVTVIYGTNKDTPVLVEARTDIEIAAVQNFDEILPHTVLGETWYHDTDQESGDGTVPLASSMEQFLGDSRVTLKPFTEGVNTGESVGHTDLVGNPDVQKTILDVLGKQYQDDDIKTGAGTDVTYVVSAIFDPVEGFLVDGSGRRLGYSTATGALSEIPGSIWFGGSDGMGWVFGTLQEPLSLQLSGLGGSYYVMVDGETPTQQGGLVLSGELSLGETISTPILLEPKNHITTYLPIVLR